MPELLPAEDPSRLKRFAVFAFCAEITRLPSHCDPLVVPENATAQTVPSRATMVAHILRSNPLSSTRTASVRAAFSAAWPGRLAQLLLTLCAHAVIGPIPTHNETTAIVVDNFKDQLW